MIENRIPSKIVMGGGKIPSISAIRLFAMVCIIACHFCQYYELEAAWWLNVGVQIFFIISGFLYGNKIIGEPIEWIIKQVKKILIPYYLFLFFAIVGYAIVAPEMLEIENVMSAILTVGQIKGISHLWFVSNILFCYLITPYLAALRDYLNNKSLQHTLLVLFCVFGIYSLIGILTNDYFRPGRIDCYILGYYTAVLCKRYGQKVLRWSMGLSLIPCICSNVVYCYFRYTKCLQMEGVFSHLTDYSHLFLGFTITLALMILLQNIRYRNILRISDKYSYEIYLVHQLFILSPLSLITISDNIVLNIVTTSAIILFAGITLQKAKDTIHTIIFKSDVSVKGFIN